MRVSRFAEITEALRATCGEGQALTSRVERVRVSAANLTVRADAHGWTGVAVSMWGAVDALGGVVTELAEFQRAGAAAVAELEVIDDQGSVDQVSVRLSGARQELMAAMQKVAAATGLVDAALHACAQAGQRGLPTALTVLRDDGQFSRRR